jgi:ADP-heptose:LPS heptosyltransferase
MATKICIIMPELIGDSIMVFPLLNKLKLNYELYVISNVYVFEIVQHLLQNSVFKLSWVNSDTFDIVIDFLSDFDSAKFISKNKSIITIGFNDGYYKYDKSLNLPSNYRNKPATYIFNQAVNLIGIHESNCEDWKYNFECKQTWKYQNQEEVLVFPGPGKSCRFFHTNEFNNLCSSLEFNKINVLLGPREKFLKGKIHNVSNILISDNIQKTIDILNSHSILISSETGLMHIAGALGMPLVGIFKSADPNNWFPYKNKNQVAISDKLNTQNYLKKESSQNKKLNIPKIISTINNILLQYETSETIHSMQNLRN